MTDLEKPQMIKLLAGVLASYGKPLPEAGMIKAWVANLTPYPLRVIEAAFQAYLDESGEFAPVPAGIAMRCKLMDGRPGAEEAWAIALTSRDEADTVVWTAECAEAFALARPILEMGDEVGARMAFKESYQRLVAQARTDRRPANWVASIGWDKTQHEKVLSKAIQAGQLPAPSVAGLLQSVVVAPTPDDRARAQLAEVRRLLIDGAEAKERARLEAVECQRIEDEEWRRSTNEQVVLRLELEGRHGTQGIGPLRSHAPNQTNGLEGCK